MDTAIFEIKLRINSTIASTANVTSIRTSWTVICLCSLNSLGKNAGVGCHALLQRIFPIQGSNPGFPHCRQILYHLSYQGAHSLEKYLFKFLANLKIGLYEGFKTKFCEFPIFFGFFTS